MGLLKANNCRFPQAVFRNKDETHLTGSDSLIDVTERNKFCEYLHDEQRCLILQLQTTSCASTLSVALQFKSYCSFYD